MLQFKPKTFGEKYKKKWNISCSDFYEMYVNGKKIEGVFRTGMYSLPKNDVKYFILLKYEETFYEDDITTDAKRKRHLAGSWCIFDDAGNIKMKTDGFGSIYLHGGVICSKDSVYYNIETGEKYGETNGALSSDEFIFARTCFSTDREKPSGILKIEKSTGKYELFSKKW